jgi:DNA-binding MarR family transcriptional regulator
MSDHLAALTSLLNGDKALGALTHRDMQVLALISKQRQPISQTKAAEMLKVSQPQVNRIVKKLISLGHLHSERDPKDNRFTILTATKEGRAVDGRVRKHFNTAMQTERTPAA